MTDNQSLEIGAALRLPIARCNLAADSARPYPGGFSFGIDPEGCAAALRDLADAIDRKEALVQGVNHIVTAKIDDFAMHTVVIEFASKA